MATTSAQQRVPTIASSAFVETHPELHHYTDLAGLKGILESRSLWATHYRDLNDSTEVQLLQNPLSRALEKRFLDFLREKQRESFSIRRAIQDTGGLQFVAKDTARSLVRSLYQATFDNKGQSGLDPFVSSFCTHASCEAAYEREHGLLSQWRGYGGTGGYCLVFDTPSVAELLAQEFSSFYYVHANIDTARYGTPDTSIEDLFPDLLTRAEQFLGAHLDGGDRLAVAEDGFAPFVSSATLYKHQGFREESEARIVVLPGSPELQQRMLEKYPHAKPMITKTIHNYNGRRHIHLFDSFQRALPIRRIIVGPSRNQTANLEQARAVVQCRISIAASETPYIG